MASRKLRLVAASVVGAVCAVTGMPTALAAPATSPWINPGDIPLDSAFHWTAPAASAHQVTSPLFAFEQACGSTPEPWRTNIEGSGYSAQAAPFGKAGTDWQGQQLILKPPGTGDNSINGARSVFNVLQTEVTSCANAPNGAQAAITWQGDGPTNRLPIKGFSGLAAVVQHSPMGELHDYLLVAYCNNTGTVAELALWASQPSQPWSARSDVEVLTAINASLCG
jgi:hypothetical protein